MLIADLRELCKENGLELKRPKGNTLYLVFHNGKHVNAFSKNEIKELGPASAGYRINRIREQLPRVDEKVKNMLLREVLANIEQQLQKIHSSDQPAEDLEKLLWYVQSAIKTTEV